MNTARQQVFANKWDGGINLMQYYAGKAMEKFIERGYHVTSSSEFGKLAEMSFDLGECMVREYVRRTT
jgi:hypothetical protein